MSLKQRAWDVLESIPDPEIPVLTIADQFYDVLKTHVDMSRAKARERVIPAYSDTRLVADMAGLYARLLPGPPELGG